MEIKKEIIERALDAANLLIERGGTLRSLSESLGVNRQTIWNDFKIILPQIDTELAEQVSNILADNKKNRASRGGKALKAKRERGNINEILYKG